MAQKIQLPKEARPTIASSLRALFRYRLISRAYFHLPVFFVYLYLHGQQVATIEGLLALYGLAILIVGPLVARLNRVQGPRASLAEGELAKLVGLVVLGFSPTLVWGLAIGQILSGAGYALTSSVEASAVGLLEPDRDRVGRIQSSTQSWIFAVVLVSGVSGAIIFTHAQLSVFLLSAAACLVAVVQLVELHLPKRANAARTLAKARTRATAVWPWIAYYVAIRSVALACFVGFIPYLLFVQAHVSLVFFGIMLALFNLAAFPIARWNKQIVDTIGYTALLCGTLACLAASLTLLGYSSEPLLIALAIALLGAAAGAARPVTQAGLAAVPPEGRQQVNARMEQITGAANAAVLGLGGLLLEHGKVTVLMLTAAVIVVICGLILLLATRRAAATSDGSAEAT